MDMVERLSASLDADAVPVEGSAGHHRLLLRDGTVVLDVLSPARPEHLVFLFPGGGLNAAANFFTARRRSLARFLADHGRLVIGVTPREDAITSPDNGPRGAEWGLAAHRRDAQRVIGSAEAVAGLPYDLLGHSAGAALALDIASHTIHADHAAGLRRVLVLDTTGPYDPATEPDLVDRAAALTDHCRQQLEQGTYFLDPGLKGLFARAGAEPDVSSGVPRPGPGSAPFTNLGLLHYALTRTSRLPGPANWIYHQGHSSGSYEIGESPAQDRFALDRTPLAVWTAAVEKLGSGLQPTALLRDLAALWSGRQDVYRIDWTAISADVVWVNTALGRGDHDFGARLIRAAGTRVDYRVVPEYGHGDIVWASDAAYKVWEGLLPTR